MCQSARPPGQPPPSGSEKRRAKRPWRAGWFACASVNRRARGKTGGRSWAILAIVLHDDILEFRFDYFEIFNRESAQDFQERSQEAFHFEGPQAGRGLDQRSE